MVHVARSTSVWLALLIALGALAAVAPAIAEETEKPGELASVWVFWPQPGHQAELEAGIKAHGAWRRESGEGWVWNVYQPVVGDDLAHYVIRSAGHHWADLDAQEAWERESGAVARYMEQMGVHVARAEHYLMQMDAEHSKWDFEGIPRFVGVGTHHLQPGAYARMLEALGKVHQAAVEGSWPQSWGIAWIIGGGGGMTVATPFANWADMAEPDPPFMKLLTDALGSPEAARETMEQLQGAFADESYTIYAFRPDLSTPR